MKIIDLTSKAKEKYSTSIVRIPMPEHTYNGIIHSFNLSSMSGTYLDLPGHIEEFKNGFDAENYPVEKLFMVDTTVIHLNRKGLGREISAREIEEAGIRVDTGCLLIDAGWESRHKDSNEGIFFYGKDAIEWIISQPIHLFISDVYENHSQPRGIFVELFKAGISCVCIPTNLEKISKTRIKICALPIKIPGALQIPCRLLALE
jgi:kynurenine formamidase